MIWLVAIASALAQDCQHTPLVEVRAAEWAEASPEYRRLAREKRHASMQFVKELLAGGTLHGERKAELMLRMAELYLDEGIDQLLSEGGGGRAWIERSLKLSTSVLKNYPTYERRWQVQASAIDALTWLGRFDEALALGPEDEHVHADLLWALDRFDEACALHGDDDPPVERHPVLVEAEAHRERLADTLAVQFAWLREHPEDPRVTDLLALWMREDDRAGLAVWFELFPESADQRRLSAEQILELAQVPGLHFDTQLAKLRAEGAEALAACESLQAAADACVNGDPSKALPLHPHLGPDDALLACLDVEIAWRKTQDNASGWDEAAFGDLAECVAGS